MINLIRKDGYINLNQLCKAGGREFRKWKKNKRAKEFLVELSKYINIPENKLIQYEINSKKDQANWGHPQVATTVAQWVSVEFSVRISIWIEEWKLNENNKGKYYNSITEINGRNNDNKEKKIQLNLQKELGGEIEVKIQEGRIDLLTKTEIIEIKNANNWKHALGQILIYGLYYPTHKKRIHLFDMTDNIVNIQQTLSKFDVVLTYE
jgi:hypothetical protein